MSNIRDIIASGAVLTLEQDDEAYALLSPEDYYAIPDHQKPDRFSEPDVPQANATFTFTIDNVHLLRGAWCVYTVNDLYLGCCRLEQLMLIPDVARSSSFKTFMPPSKAITIKLLAHFPSNSLAKTYYDSLNSTGQYMPRNAGTIEKFGKRRSYRVRCTSDGNVFNSVKEAAEFYNVSTTSIYDTVNGRTNIRNLGFERV